MNQKQKKKFKRQLSRRKNSFKYTCGYKNGIEKKEDAIEDAKINCNTNGVKTNKDNYYTNCYSQTVVDE